MERTQVNTMLVLSAVMLFIGLLLTFWEPAEDPWDETATEVVWSVVASEVTSVFITRPETSLRLELRDDEWHLTEPIAYRANALVVEQLVEGLAALKVGIAVRDEGQASDFGLGSDPVARVTLTLRDGTSATLDVGREAPIGNRMYVRPEGGSVVAVQGRPPDALVMEVQELQDERVFRFAPGKVRALSLASPEGTLRVSGEGLDWWMRGFSRADPDRVDDLVLGLLDLRVIGFYSEPTVIATPSRVVTVTLEDGQEHELVVGQSTAGGVLAQLPTGAMALLDAQQIALLGQGPPDIGVQYPLNTQEADDVKILGGNQPWHAEREEDGWKRSGFIDPEAASVLASLSSVQMVYRRESAPALSEVWATMQVQVGPRVQEVQIGQVVEEAFRVARFKNGGEPFRLQRSELAVLKGVLPGEP
jgi:hypothetical protein